MDTNDSSSSLCIQITVAYNDHISLYTVSILERRPIKNARSQNNTQLYIFNKHVLLWKKVSLCAPLYSRGPITCEIVHLVVREAYKDLRLSMRKAEHVLKCSEGKPLLAQRDLHNTLSTVTVYTCSSYIKCTPDHLIDVPGFFNYLVCSN